VSKNNNLREVMTLGRNFARPFFNVYDSGVDFGHFGGIKYDDEGTPMEKTYLIKDGNLVGRLHSRESAAAMGERPTGSARAISYKFPPIPRMRNTCIEGGDAEFEDMIKDVGLGVYVKTPRGGQTGGEMFTFTAAQAFMIRNGKIAEPVRGVTIAGNLFETLKDIDMVGKDFKIKAGSCGKGEQYPLPVSSSGPHIRMNNVVVGGQ
jgi:TldD protein